MIKITPRHVLNHLELRAQICYMKVARVLE